MIKSPKERFQQSQIAVGQWMQIASNPIFEDACDVALLQLQEQLPMQSESHLQMVGAQQLVRILKTLHEITNKPQEKTAQGLNYKAGV